MAERKKTDGAGARVLLAVPVASETDKGLAHRYYPPHMGLASIAACLLENGVAVRIFDGGVTGSRDAFRAVLRDFSPDVVGVTAYTREIYAAARMAEAVKETLPEAMAVLGGPHATALPAGSLEEFPAFDAVVAGEGEQALLDLVRARGREKLLEAIPGVAFRRRGKPFFTGERREQLDINLLPRPAWHLFPLNAYKGMSFGHGALSSRVAEFRVRVSNGCPYRCTFCSHTLRYDGRWKTVENTAEEIAWLVRIFGAGRILFTSETFTLDPDYVERLCAEMVRRGLHRRVRWCCQTRIDRIDPGLAESMHRAGCSLVFIGIESGSEEMLACMNKGFTLESIRGNVAALRRAGISVMSNFLMGFPGETAKDIKKTIDFSLRLGLDYASYGIVIPYPGTRLRAEIESSGGGGLCSDWERYDTQSGAGLFRRSRLSERQLGFYHALAYLRFYGRPGFMAKPLRFISLPSLGAHLRARFSPGRKRPAQE